MTKDTADIRIALVGLGGHGRTIQHAVEASGRFDVRAVFDPDGAEASASAERFGAEAVASFDDLLRRDDLDAVTLCSPNHVHRAQAEAAFAAGLDVFVEKPLANTVADARAMVEAAEATGHVLMVGHNMRRGEAMRRAADVVRTGRIGEVASFEVHFSSDTALGLDATSWRLRPDRCPLLPMMQLGIHGVDFIHAALGPVDEVYASARAVAVPPGVVDSIAATLHLADGRHGTMISNYCSAVQFAYRISGTRGTLVGTPHTLTVLDASGREIEQRDTSADPFGSYVAQMIAFAEHVGERTTPETDGRAGLRALAVVEAMQESIARKVPVRVPTLTPQPKS